MPESAGPVPEAALWRLQAWLRVPASARPKIYSQIFAATESSLIYWLEIIFSAGIATFGLVQNSPAVIIGAMLISPLMGPILATGLALAVGDVYLGIKAVVNLLASIAVSIAFAGILVWLLPFHSATPEIVSRVNPNLLDLGIALLSGLAGSVLVCRGGGEGATALPGVAIAVALMPPLCTMGFGLGAGLNLDIMGGAGLLFLTNLVAIVASAFVIFLIVGMRTAEVEEAAFAFRRSDTLAQRLSHGPVAQMFTTGGQLRWRIVMVLVLLGSIAVPLRRALMQVAGETLTRAAVQEDLKRLVSPGSIVTQQVDVAKNDISIHLISTRPIPGAKVTETRDDLMRRTGRSVQISVEAVASQSALAALMERLSRPASAPPPPAPKPPSVAEMQQALLGRIRPAVEDIWPAADAPIQNFGVTLGATGLTVDVQYQAPKDLGDVATDIILRNLRTKLAIPDLALKTERAPPPRAPRAARQSGNKTIVKAR